LQARLMPGLVNAYWSGSQFSYWSVLILGTATQASPGAATSIGELEFAASPGGATLCVGGTPICSSAQLLNPAASAFNGSTSGQWGPQPSTNCLGEWLGYQFPSPVNPAEVRIWHRSDVNRGESPTAFIVRSSDDGVTWKPRKLFVGFGVWTSLGEIKTFSMVGATEIAPTEKLLWAIDILSTNGATEPRVGDLEMAESPGGANVAVLDFAYGSPISSMNRDYGGRPQNAFDGSTSTSWGTPNVTAGAAAGKLGYAFPTSKNIVEIRLKGPSSNAATRMPKDFNVVWSHDGVTWNVVKSVTNQSWANNETKTYSIP
jgi:hypothetical protein